MGRSGESQTYFIVTYRDPKDGEINTLKVNLIADSSLGLSFICVSNFIFDTKSVVVNPAEEALQKRFENVKSLHLSIYSVLSIEEVGKNHDGLYFKKDKSNLVAFPTDTHSTQKV